MTRVSRGKDFESFVRRAFELVPDTSVDRLHDQMTGFKGSTNICDLIVYHYPRQFYIECKSVHGNVLPFSNITKVQWYGLLDKSEIDGVVAGIICWFVDQDVTVFYPIELLQELMNNGAKSVRFDKTFTTEWNWHYIQGQKRRIYYDYDMSVYFDEVEEYYERIR